jgi:PAS domain S-box-containing protein
VVGYVNPATVRLCGQESAEAMQGLALQSLLRDASLADAMRAAVTRGGTWSGEATLVRRDGSEVHVQASVAGNRDADDQLVGMVFSFVDISDRLRAEEAERQAERQRVMMESLGAACHHLGQPSTVLLSSLELMARMKDKDRRAVDELLSSSLAAAESLRKMLHDLNEMTEYRTVPYVEGVGRNGADTRIIAL